MRMLSCPKTDVVNDARVASCKQLSWVHSRLRYAETRKARKAIESAASLPASLTA